MSALRILVADDNPLSLRFFAEALGGFGHACTVAADGAEALHLARTAAFDLLLLDARMPELGGIEVLLALRSGDGASRHAPAIATTAADDAQARADLLAAGFLAVLGKPLGVAELKQTLTSHLPTGAPSDDALDEAQALAAAGGDAAIVAALRSLFAAELEALPDEVAAFAATSDAVALRERLHRLDASAGFCGARALREAGARLRVALAAEPWPRAAIEDFLRRCARTRALLA